jgi:hypothetical protein
LPVALGFQGVAVDEAQSSGVDAISQSTLGAGAVVEDVTEVAVAVRRTHLGAHHRVAHVDLLGDVVPIDRFGEAGPAGSAVELVHRGEQRFTGYHVDVDSRFMVVPVLAGERPFGTVLLGDVVLVGVQRADRVGIPVVIVLLHLSSSVVVGDRPASGS